eukprot:5443472-Alexandrium_andersonii.AAC.1
MWCGWRVWKFVGGWRWSGQLAAVGRRSRHGRPGRRRASPPSVGWARATHCPPRPTHLIGQVPTVYDRFGGVLVVVVV